MQIHEHYPLKAQNTFGFDVKARYYAEPSSLEELKSLFSDIFFRELPLVALGEGSNLLFCRDFEGLVVHPRFMEITSTALPNSEVMISAGAGVIWDSLVAHCVAQAWGGLENLSGIPGTVGAAPIQNIGAYGAEVKDTITEVEAIRLDSLETIRFSNADCGFGYRDSIFKQAWKNKLLITKVSFCLSTQSKLNIQYDSLSKLLQAMPKIGIQEVRETVLQIRKEKLPDPAEIGNAGSFFKNPTVTEATALALQARYPQLTVYPTGKGQAKIPAGWLIEQCGWKGKQRGRVGVHKAQALVLVNYGGGTGEEILQLAAAIQQSVAERFNIALEMEVNVV
ncbi:MAG: UDP-N-acetylmuramate dehydrogenase [Bacteroidales bacterium]|nr:UDP-N-acetylmuramate dehydrogenase [Bacteroidales bacterium]MCL2133481.1 UDP-N-acetylmuramate dehydrogenase [Bacteroidales bacterium]